MPAAIRIAIAKRAVAANRANWSGVKVLIAAERLAG